MSDTPNNPSDGAKAPDELGNFKQEINRKLANQESTIKELANANKALLEKLSTLTQPQPARQEDDFDKVWYEDPKTAAKRIKDQTRNEIMAEYKQDQERQRQTQNTLASLVSDYPELNDQSHELTRKAVEYYNALPESDKSSPSAYKLAVKDAASDLGILPVKRRPNTDTDSFSASSSSGYQVAQGKRGAQKEGDLDPRTIAFAQLVGLDTSNQKTMESLKAKAQRKSWNRFE